MQILRLALKWTLGCAGLGLLALHGSHAAAAPTADLQAHRDRMNAATSAEVSRDLIRGAILADRFQPSDADRSASPRHSRSDQHRSRRAARRHAGVVDYLPAETPVRPADLVAAVSTPSNPIPEPSSMLLFAAGLGLVAWITRKKLV